ncbi:kelch domain-containing protein 4-like isoform X1 [Lytechinus variegatus]|uniref:kelch domain-containing protein 4-like isoform X1 n=1 Tax=Lytechinus variegatus TaxID=7654 RepID=UPI001BB1375D|nr:kelch domain-containing protein 4-like isoform X1 [Lytechinus variegatus]XP_041475912.1 kelch domain-containing protein 4-like isoform X1 [Lytechinus variegatus]XP_041475913.1 kelch domain-containing protein 4-like isoform X1 [Lytechinus variegatus]XP_041475914.1 kelch domain-containing protein 4-like isoform X1 [Lytechinus variegatus]
MALAVISLKWVHREIHGKPPSPRQGHSACVIGSVAYIFGGIRSVDWPKKGTYFFRDLFQLHLYKRMQWEKVKQKGEIPKGRYGHHMCVIGHKIYLFGGKHELHADKCLPGLHVYDTEKKEWSQPQTSGTEPEAHGSTSSVVGTRIYVYGGLVDGQAVDDLHCFDSENQWWVKLTVQGVPPSPRCDSASTAVGHEMFIFGGTAGTDKWFNDIHVFDAKKLLWKELNKTDGEPPTPRGNHCFLAHVDKDIYVFGGSNDSNSSHPTLGDLYKFSLDKRKWKRPFYGGCPPAKRSGHAAIIHRSKLIIIGGSNEDTDFNDVHVAKLINPSKRQPLKVPAGDMHDFLDTINNADPRPTVVDGEDAEAHFHEKEEEAEEDPAPDLKETEGSREGHVNQEGPGSKQEDSVAGSDPDMKGGPGKSVHFEDEESEKQDGASLSSSAGSLSSSAGSLSSASSSSSGSSEGSTSSDSKGNTNNSNSNNSALGVRTRRQQDGIRRDTVKEVEEKGSDGGLEDSVGRQVDDDEEEDDGKADVASGSSSQQGTQDNQADDSTSPIQPGKEKLAPISKAETKMSGAKQGKKAGAKKQKKKPKQETSNGTSVYETQLPPAGYRPYPPMEIPMQNWQRAPEEAAWHQYPEDWRTQNQLHSPAHQPQERPESEEESESESGSDSESEESEDSDDGGDDGGSQTENPEVRNMNGYDDSLSSGRQGEDTKEEDESEDGDDGSDEDSDEEEGEDDDEEEEEGDEDESGSGTGSDSESGSGSEDESESEED